MKPIVKGLLVAAIQVALVASLGAKLLWDRSTMPQVWMRVAPVDPELPIRGRYVRLEVVIEERNLRGTLAAPSPGRTYVSPAPVTLSVESDRLIATVQPGSDRFRSSDLRASRRQTREGSLVTLDNEVAFFIPEHAPDPSRRAANEQLWLEATIPPKGPPRPLRLGVRTDGGPIAPLDLN
jgi:hypothetical protein